MGSCRRNYTSRREPAIYFYIFCHYLLIRRARPRETLNIQLFAYVRTSSKASRVETSTMIPTERNVNDAASSSVARDTRVLPFPRKRTEKGETNFNTNDSVTVSRFRGVPLSRMRAHEISRPEYENQWRAIRTI